MMYLSVTWTLLRNLHLRCTNTNINTNNETYIITCSQIVLFATVGSQFTSAAVVSYSQVKDKVTKEQVPTVQVMGVG